MTSRSEAPLPAPRGSFGSRLFDLLTERAGPKAAQLTPPEPDADIVHDEDLQVSLWTLYEQLHQQGAPLSLRRVGDRSEIFPVFRELFERRPAREAAAP